MSVCVTLAGSYRGERFEKMLNLKSELQKNGIDVLYPPDGELDNNGFGFFESDISDDEVKVERQFIEKTLLNCDAIIFCNYDNHLGSTSTMEFEIFNKINSNFKGLERPFPIYLLEDINPNELSSQARSLAIANIANGSLRIGIDTFYKDFGKKQEPFTR